MNFILKKWLLLSILIVSAATLNGAELQKRILYSTEWEPAEDNLPDSTKSAAMVVPVPRSLTNSPSPFNVEGAVEQIPLGVHGGLSLVFTVKNVSTGPLEIYNPLYSVSFGIKDKTTGKQVGPLSPAELGVIHSKKSMYEKVQDQGHFKMLVDSNPVTRDQDIVQINSGETRTFEFQIVEAQLRQNGKLVPKKMRDMTGCFSVNAVVGIRGPEIDDSVTHLFVGEICLDK